ncbi:MAG: hypothetical protein IJE78_03185 [Bacteroidaceae bacterium]|nr:hypothetical protein [Bacteroidaceae bacterium]
MEKEILLLKEEVLALRQQIERLIKKLEDLNPNKDLIDLNLNLKRKEISAVERKDSIIVNPIIVEPMKHPYAKEIIKLALNHKVKTLKSTERYGHTTIRKIKSNSRFKK